MRSNISLYIKDQLVDLNDSSFILFNYSQEDTTDPAIVRNSYSQSVTLPATSTNCAIFSSFGRYDRINNDPGFSSAKKEPFVIFSETGEILQKGYCKLDQVVRRMGGYPPTRCPSLAVLGLSFGNFHLMRMGTRGILGTCHTRMTMVLSMRTHIHSQWMYRPHGTTCSPEVCPACPASSTSRQCTMACRTTLLQTRLMSSPGCSTILEQGNTMNRKMPGIVREVVRLCHITSSSQAHR